MSLFVALVVLMPLQVPETSLIDEDGTPAASQAPVVVDSVDGRPADAGLNVDAVEPIVEPVVEPAEPIAPAPVVEPVTAPVRMPTPPPSLFDDGELGSYLVWYGPEYLVAGALAGLYLAGVPDHLPVAPALLGPQLSVERMNTAVLFDPRLDDVIGRPYVREKVPTTALIVGAATVILGATATDYAVTGDLHRTNAVFLSGLEALMGTVLVTEITKVTFGRLRPDFRARYVNAACHGTITGPDSLDCSGADLSFRLDQDDLNDGFKSFISGHSSTSFAMATWGSWWLATTLITPDDRPAWGPAVGALSIGALYSTAGFIAATRVADNRHHVEDIVTGAAVGATLGSAFFLLHFDLDGRARTRWLKDVTVVPTTGMGETGTGNGLALVGKLP